MKKSRIPLLALVAAIAIPANANQERPRQEKNDPGVKPDASDVPALYDKESGEILMGFRRIFNGKNLKGWAGDMTFWSVKDGAIVGQSTPENSPKVNTFLVWTNGTVSDFELRFSYKIIPNNDKGAANSGVQYRSKVLDEKNLGVGGYQADFEAGDRYSGILYEEKMSRGIMAARSEKVLWTKDCKKEVVGSLGSSDEIQASIKKNDWNDYVIIAKGAHLQHFINGQITVDVTDECESKRAMEGVIALQLHTGPPMTVLFKDLRLKQRLK